MKICFLHPMVNDIPSFLKFTYLKGKVDPGSLEWDDAEPDVLFASEWIYYKEAFYRKFCNLYGKAWLKVAYFGEALEVDWNIFDYGIGFSDMLESFPRFIRLLSPTDMYTGFIPRGQNEISGPDEAVSLLKGKTGFCNFLYSNAKAHPMRDRLFYEISKYKRVDSLGKHLNNVGIPGTGYGNGHAIECVALKSPYKFSISSENAVFSGYTSEKCFTSLLAHTVPVYWGNPNIRDDVNPSAFINVGDFESLDAAMERIKEVDSDDSLWAGMVCSPWRTPLQEAAHVRRTEDYYSGMLALLSGKLTEAVPCGFHPGMYKDYFLRGRFPMDRVWIERLCGKISGGFHFLNDKR